MHHYIYQKNRKVQGYKLSVTRLEPIHYEPTQQQGEQSEDVFHNVLYILLWLNKTKCLNSVLYKLTPILFRTSCLQHGINIKEIIQGVLFGFKLQGIIYAFKY